MMTLTSAQSSSLSQACINNGISPLISNQELNTCIPLASLAPVASAGGIPTDTVLIQAADKLCAAVKCSDNLITTVRNNFEQACATDLDNQVPAALAIDFIFSYYPPIRGSLCLKNSTNGYCFVETFDNVNEYMKNNPSVAKSLSFDSALDILSQAPTNIVCTTCNKAIAGNFFNYQDANPNTTKRFAIPVASVKSVFVTKCASLTKPLTDYFETPREKFFREDYLDPTKDPELTNSTKRAKGVILILARNGELEGIKPSIEQLERYWNNKYNYPYVFLNDDDFTEEFIQGTSSMMPKSTVKYGRIPKEHWSYPEWINQTRAAENRELSAQRHIIYGGSESYRHMCRFNSGFFFRHELLKDYDYYWRVEPYVNFYCDVDYDPFLFMEKNKLKYGFTITFHEFENTIPTLWQTVRQFTKEYPDLIPKDNTLKWITDDDGETYNLCHFWSNFEIGDLNFWRSEKYLKFFEYLDNAGGFFYERWGDAPVHSIAAALFLNKSQIHFFNDIGYKHNPFTHCPVNKEIQESGKCNCNASDSFGLGPTSPA
ncbi:13003_t:CDS:2 [Entrophospora sp. SA101]|nr:13003_t:CDS:2 [Entrophospora sp. SA101]